MTVRVTGDGTIELEGICPLEDAERLQQYLLADPRASVDWRNCMSAHTAVVQMLMASRAILLGPPKADFLQKHLQLCDENVAGRLYPMKLVR